MTDFRKHKWLICWVAVFVLLSFFYIEPAARAAEAGNAACSTAAAAYSDGAGWSVAAELKSPALIDTGRNQLPQQNGRVTADRFMQNEVAARQQSGSASLLVRFFAVAVMFLLLICMSSRILMRRFCPRAIALWRNIYYIHQMDGKKGKHFCIYIG